MKNTSPKRQMPSGISPKGLVAWLAAAALLLTACIALIRLTDADQGFPVSITEVLASNTAFPNADGRCTDFIEICNSADYPVDLTGFQLGDKVIRFAMVKVAN